ncbi:hypothetical protein JJB11_09615 [Ramlibacter ginsenosidimutans]|uniref:Uncharacterized protein n=1 Tax=Ramlibacter ginsenosidimutans TaxID=502333 RepID=A0A934WMN6_9BURK|nr:hypothetical protein [Ramlibacter ginsenosidimutans]MBK6006347.1 hypothetical protein [Ramlibacter ginsenosidimutans]
MPEWKDVLAALASLVASFAGAWAAFKFQTFQKKDDEDQKAVGAGNRAIYTVFALWNVLEQYRKEVMEPYRGKPDAWLNLAAHPAPPAKVDRFQSSDLQFLLERGQASVFASLMLEEQRFNLAVDLIRSRSELVLNAVFPKMATAGFKVGQDQSLNDVEAALGEDVCHQLKQITAAIYQIVGEDLVSLRALYTELRTGLQTLFPQRKFVEVVFQEPAKAANAAAAA